MDGYVSRAWTFLQRRLFPMLQEEFGPLTEAERRLVSALELIGVERLVPAPLRGVVGNPEYDRRPLARAFVAKAVLALVDTRRLLERLKSSPALRRICGWERAGEIPSESCFSRAFAAFAAGALPQRLHEALAKAYGEEKLAGHVSRDSTAIEGREKARPKPKKEKNPALKPARRPQKGEAHPPPEPTRLERQASGTLSVEDMVNELPTACDWGCKRNSRGQAEIWRGCKLHVDWADGGVPLSALVTSASLHDSQAAIPLALLTNERATNLYDLMDSAYDAVLIRAHSLSLGHVPIIERKFRRGVQAREEAAAERRRQALTGHVPSEQTRYKERTTAERGNARLKEEFGGRFVRVRGHAKVAAHLFFGLLALTADALLRLVQ